MEKKTIGSFIATLRKAKGLTQRELAEMLNVSDKAVSRWERNESAPDLSLIPVIADIFGITSDELLRGQRNHATSDPAREAAKTEKLIRNFLNRAMTRFRIGCLVSGAVALVGLIGAMILNYGFLRAYVGFFVSCIFFIAAALCQIIFQILGSRAIATEDVPAELLKPAQRTLVMGAELAFGLIFVLFAVCLPLIVLPVGTFRGLTASSWLEYGSFSGLIAGMLWLVGCAVLNRSKGYWKQIDWHSPHNRLRLKWLRKGSLLLLAVLLLHLGSTELVAQNYHLLVRGKKFDDWTTFRRYMETPTDTDGTDLTFLEIDGTGDNTRYIYENQDGEAIVFHKSDISHKLYASAEDEAAGSEPLVRYRHLNKQVQTVRTTRGGLPVQVFTRLQITIVRLITFCIHLLWGLVYFLTGRKVLRKYRQEVKQYLR